MQIADNPIILEANLHRKAFCLQFWPLILNLVIIKPQPINITKRHYHCSLVFNSLSL